MVDDDPRMALAALVADADGESLASLSRLIGRNAAYLQQYVRRGTPRRLAEADRGRLARYFGIAEERLGGPAQPETARIAVRRLDVAAAAGAGALVEREEVIGTLAFDQGFLRSLGVRGPLSTIRALGDSMLPGIADGDEMLVDGGDRDLDAGGGVFVVRIAGAVMVKRVRRLGDALDIASDNAASPPVRFEGADVTVLGRVVWLGRAVL